MTTPEPSLMEGAPPSERSKGIANLELASEKLLLSIPDGWCANSKVYDRHGRVRFVVVKNLTRRRHKEQHWAQICDAEYHPLALIRRRPPSTCTVNDTYEFFTYTPNCDGQLFHDRDQDSAPIYEFAYLKQGLFWSNYWYHSLADETPLKGPSTLVGQNRRFSWVASCCTFALCCSKWHIEFKRNERVYLTIDQSKSTMEVSPGMDIVASVCIAYAFDRFTRHPFACKDGGSRINIDQEGNTEIKATNEIAK